MDEINITPMGAGTAVKRIVIVVGVSVIVGFIYGIVVYLLHRKLFY